jgi:VIT1/CCC1 family predicted Fe2+/Mn2+ transporter
MDMQHDHPDLSHSSSLGNALNALRAAVLGANDGIISTAGVVVGVAGAGAAISDSALLITGVATLVAGAISMAAGEYVSVSTQRDTEQAALHEEARHLAQYPKHELAQLAQILQSNGVSPELAVQAAEQMMAQDALGAHAKLELGINPGELTNPWHAAWASMLSFSLGALVPLAAVLLTPRAQAVPVTFAAVLAALAATGWGSAKLGGAPRGPATVRNVVGGVLAMGVTWLVGRWFGA